MVLRLLDTGAEAVEEVDGAHASRCAALRSLWLGRAGPQSGSQRPPRALLLAHRTSLCPRLHPAPTPAGIDAVEAVQYGAAPPELQRMAAALVDKYYGADNEP